MHRWSEFARDGAPWNADEEEWLFQHYILGTSLVWLSSQLSRTQSAVKARIKQRRNNPALPPLLQHAPPAAAAAADSPRPEAGVEGSAADASARAANVRVACCAGTGGDAAQVVAEQAVSMQSASQPRLAVAAVAHSARAKLLPCVVHGSTSDSKARLCRELLSAAVASARDGMVCAAAAGDAERHAVEATIAAAAHLLAPEQDDLSAAPAVGVSATLITDACNSAAACYFEYLGTQGMHHASERTESARCVDTSWLSLQQVPASGACRLAAAALAPMAPTTSASAAPLNLACRAPAHLEALSDGELRACVLPDADVALASAAPRNALLDAAAGLHAWEVRRLLACAALPEPQRFHVALRLGSESDGEGRAGLERRARAAARKLCLLTHPDKTLVQGSSEAFLIVQRALQHFQCADEYSIAN